MNAHLIQSLDLLDQITEYAKKRCNGIEDNYEAKEVLQDIAEKLIECSTDLQAAIYTLERMINSTFK